jgi:hypothetical protein
MKYTPSTNTDPTKATYGTKGSDVLALQNAINAVSPTKIASDSMYGNQTKGAYEGLIGQGYVYQNGAFTKPAPIPDTTTKTDTTTGGTPNITPVTPTPSRFIYTDDKTPKAVAEKSVDEVQRELLTQSQSEIDNINAYYDSVYNETKTLNEKNTRGTNAISVLSGLSGSTEAEVASRETEKGNTAQLNKVNQERNLAVNAILSKIRTNAVDQARQSRLDAQKSEEDRIAYRTKQAEESKNMLMSLSKSGSGATLEGLKSTLDGASYKHLIDSVGGEANAQAILFENRQKSTVLGTPQLIGGKLVQAYQTADGKVKYEQVDLPEGVVPDKVKQIIKDDSGIYIINNDSTWSRITGSSGTGGTGGGGSKVVKSGGAIISGNLISELSDVLEKSKKAFGGDGKYVNPEAYELAYNEWVKPKSEGGLGGLGKDFLTQFPPAKYVNPANTTLPAYLRSSTKATKGRSI